MATSRPSGRENAEVVLGLGQEAVGICNAGESTSHVSVWEKTGRRGT
jgi:hypothetical protein